MEPLREAGSLGDVLVLGYLGKIKILTWNRIRTLGGVQHLCGPWEGTTDGAEFMHFGGGCTNGEKILIGSVVLELSFTTLG